MIVVILYIVKHYKTGAIDSMMYHSILMYHITLEIPCRTLACFFFWNRPFWERLAAWSFRLHNCFATWN